MALDATRLRWPGIDEVRARGAVWHLERAAQRLVTVELILATGRGSYSAAGTRLVVRQGLEHSRIARGFLGAVGFEHGGRLELERPAI